MNLIRKAALLSLGAVVIGLSGCADDHDAVMKAQNTADQAMSTAQSAQQTAQQAKQMAQQNHEAIENLRNAPPPPPPPPPHRGPRG